MKLVVIKTPDGPIVTTEEIARQYGYLPEEPESKEDTDGKTGEETRD